jgi:hypothetical protein
MLRGKMGERAVVTREMQSKEILTRETEKNKKSWEGDADSGGNRY